jgi:tetratricopeptide (TPR) repeat protein
MHFASIVKRQDSTALPDAQTQDIAIGCGRMPRDAGHPTMIARQTALAIIFCCLAAAPACRAQDVHRLSLSKEARDGLDALYRGDPDAAITEFRRVQISQRDSPAGFLLEADADWWKIFCRSIEFKWNMVDVWALGPSPEVDAMAAAVDKAVALADARIQQSETAELHIYAGFALALRARILGMRGENRASGRAGVAAREHLLRAKALDPQLADSDTGLGLYNYYIDTLSGFVKILRRFMGIPGGNKQEGIALLTFAMDHADMTAVEARFYLAIDLRRYDQQYERAATLIEPLVARYPQNPIFALMLGNMNALLNRKEKAAANYRAAAAITVADPKCREHIARIAHEGLATLSTPK